MLSQHMLLFVWDARKTFFHWIYDQNQKCNEDLSKIHVNEVKHGSNFFPENLVSKILNFWTQKYSTNIAVAVGDHGELIIPMAYLCLTPNSRIFQEIPQKPFRTPNGP